ncbi:MAG: CDP-alcohol phosphatidyltransferase family protein [Candidatus Promineifilaceae bacterium]
MADINPHKRINDILLGPLERPALRWLAAQMPAWVNPDILTLIGIGGSALIFSGYVLTNLSAGFLWLASLGFVVNWLGDSLDGTLARHRLIERPKYGYFVDHTVDAFSQFLIFSGLGLSPYVNFSVASLGLIGYLMMSVYVYVNTYVTGQFKISYGKLGPTEMRLFAILINTFIYFFGSPALGVGLPGALSLIDLVVLVLALLFVVVFGVSTLRRAAELAAAGE